MVQFVTREELRVETGRLELLLYRNQIPAGRTMDALQ